jgi:hypothetical protein
MAEYIIESIDTLERLANAEKPPLKLEEIQRLPSKFTEEGADVEGLRESLGKMEEAFETRGDVKRWSPEVLDEIDDCFRDAYMRGSDVSPHLFFPRSVENINAFRGYREAVDLVLRRRKSDVPPHAREYFAYYCVWQMRGHEFPMPLGTKTAVFALHTICDMVEPGFVEVSVVVVVVCVGGRTNG